LYNNIRYLGHGGLRTNRYRIWKQNQQQAQAQIWDDPRGYYFCNIVAVSPEAQGKGIGGMLVKKVLKMADEEGIKCYLESSKNEPNVQIYERMGFELKREMECRDGDDVCMVCFMFIF
jgi:GNAT superfamily N-acetyltransferase